MMMHGCKIADELSGLLLDSNFFTPAIMGFSGFFLYRGFGIVRITAESRYVDDEHE